MAVSAVPFCTEAVRAEENEVHLIRGIEAPEEGENELHFGVRPTLEELKEAMPDTLSAYLDKDEAATAVPVTWEPRGGEYEGTSYYYYEFLPVLPEGYRTVPTMGELPAVSVYLTNEGESDAENVTLRAVYRPENMDKIYLFLHDQIGLNIAASCGVLANIYVESAYDPEAVNDYSGAYGLCQWNGGRKTNLYNFCQTNGYKANKLNPQLKFLKYELEVLTSDSLDTLARLRAVNNTRNGAGKAGHIFCDVFERPDDPATGDNRADLAKKFWDKYGGTIYEGTERVVIKDCSIDLKADVTEFTPTSFKSSDPSVAVVTADGILTGINKGTCTVKAVAGGSSNDEKEFLINVRPVNVSKDRIIRTNETFYLDEFLTNLEKLENLGLVVTKYGSSNKKVFDVDKYDGTVTPGKNGKADLKITFKYSTSDDRSLPAGTISVRFKLKKPDIKETAVTLAPGGKQALTITNRTQDVELAFEADDPSVAEVVEENGTYYVKAVGQKGEYTDLCLYLNYETEPTDKLRVTIS